MLRLLRADVGIRPYILCRQIVGYRRGSVILLLPEEAPEKRPGEAFCCLNGWLYKTVFSYIYQAFFILSLCTKTCIHVFALCHIAFSQLFPYTLIMLFICIMGSV